MTIEARELVLFAENDYETYSRSIEPTLKNMQRKAKRGVYDPEKAVKAFEYVAEFAARRYCSEFGGHWCKVFDAATRREAARDMAERCTLDLLPA